MKKSYVETTWIIDLKIIKNKNKKNVSNKFKQKQIKRRNGIKGKNNEKEEEGLSPKVPFLLFNLFMFKFIRHILFIFIFHFF